MDNIASWNMKGLNVPNKQQEVRDFYFRNKQGLIGLVEIKVKSC